MVSLRLHVFLQVAFQVLGRAAFDSRDSVSISQHQQTALRGSNNSDEQADQELLAMKARVTLNSRRALPEDQEAVIERQAILQANEPPPQAPSQQRARLAVWVIGFPRSGSSTTLSMVKAIADTTDSQAPGPVFSLFEPCHDGDVVDPWLAEEGCSGILSHIANCDFGGVQRLWGWNQPHTSNNHTMNFSRTLANEFCSGANVIAFKTVDFGHDIGQFLWLLDREPNMRVVATVRDPRGIYASWKTTEPFQALLEQRELCNTCPGGEFYNLTVLCDAFAANLRLEDHRVHTVVFEELLRRPVEMTRRVYNFLGVPFGGPQREWIKRTFDAPDCPEEPSWHEGFADCHTKSASSTETWREILTAEEMATFAEHPTCRTVAEAYGYSLD